MRTLAIDIETFSATSLRTAGAYRYAEDPDFHILLIAYSVDDQPVQVIDLAQGDELPDWWWAAIQDPKVTKTAFNASFERICISRLARDHHIITHGYLNPAGWVCTMVWASAVGLPRSLAQVAAAILPEDQRKLASGNQLIKKFCVPAKLPAHQDDGLTLDLGLGSGRRNLPEQYPQEWEAFISYCRRDVEAEQAIRHKLQRFPLPPAVWDEYAIDQRINDRGVRIDLDFAEAAIQVDTTHRDACMAEAKQITGVDNPGSAQQLVTWLGEHGVPLGSLDKHTVAEALKDAEGDARRVLELRQELAKSSVKKYDTMCAVACADNRARGLVQFYGAGRTGRWAGRLIQVQNLPRNYLQDLGAARDTVATGDSDLVGMLYDSIPDTLSQLIRTAFTPRNGLRFIVADYSAIEARVLAWLAGEHTTLRAFKDGKDLYCATASQMFGVPVDKHGPNAELRQKGKVAVLACGYQGGVGAIKAMGGARMGLDEDEMKRIVTMWREANPNITKYWWDVDKAAKHTITTGEPTTVRNLRFMLRSRALLIQLPSGRHLVYQRPRIGTNRFGGDSIEFTGLDNSARFSTVETYGGKLVENITQAVARDLLAHALGQLEAAGHQVVMHVHDEAVVEAPASTSVAEICDVMAQAPGWAAGLPMAADGYECDYYMKD